MLCEVSPEVWLLFLLCVNNVIPVFSTASRKKWKMINHYRLGPFRRNVRDYSVHQRSAGKNAGDRLWEKELLAVNIWRNQVASVMPSRYETFPSSGLPCFDEPLY